MDGTDPVSSPPPLLSCLMHHNFCHWLFFCASSPSPFRPSLLMQKASVFCRPRLHTTFLDHQQHLCLSLTYTLFVQKSKQKQAHPNDTLSATLQICLFLSTARLKRCILSCSTVFFTSVKHVRLDRERKSRKLLVSLSSAIYYRVSNKMKKRACLLDDRESKKATGPVCPFLGRKSSYHFVKESLSRDGTAPPVSSSRPRPAPLGALKLTLREKETRRRRTKWRGRRTGWRNGDAEMESEDGGMRIAKCF